MIIIFPIARPISTGVQKLSKKAGVMIRIVHNAVATPFSTASKIVSPANISLASSQTSILFFLIFALIQARFSLYLLTNVI